MREEKDYTLWRILLLGFACTFVLFIVKLTNVFAFSWIWVFVPLWIAMGIVCLVLIILFLSAFWKEDRKQRRKHRK